MGVHTWRHPSPDAAGWLSFLAACGYVLSDIEQHVIETAGGTTNNDGDSAEDVNGERTA